MGKFNIISKLLSKYFETVSTTCSTLTPKFTGTNSVHTITEK